MSTSEAYRIPEELADEIREPEVKEIKGLCSTCRQAPTCTYRRDPDRPVMFCEEFEVEEKPPVALVTKTVAATELAEPAEEYVGSEKLKGLCQTCEHRVTCKFPKPESGVWFCEEFE